MRKLTGIFACLFLVLIFAAASAGTDTDETPVKYFFPMNLEEGIHTIRLYYGTDSGGFSSDTISVRVVNGMVTHFTIGEQEGNMSVLVSFDQVEALV